MHAEMERKALPHQSLSLSFCFSSGSQVSHICTFLQLLLDLLAPHKALCDLCISKRILSVCVAMAAGPTLLEVLGYLFGLQDMLQP